jgi:fatty acid metabolism transcriptional regulator FadR
VAQRVFAALLESLLAGRYAAGEKLPPQRTLAADLGVTMTALREALKRLEQMGLIEVRHGDAMRVRDWRAHGGLDVIAHLLLRSGAVDASVLHDVLEARTLMLREIAALAAERRSPEQAARLLELARSLAQASDDAAAQAIDFAFFTEVAQAASNLVFLLILNSIRTLYFRHAALIPVTARHDELASLYERVAEAIEHRDAPAARGAAADLATRQRERVEDALARARQP